MKVLAFNGSPRKEWNTATLARKMVTGLAFFCGVIFLASASFAAIQEEKTKEEGLKTLRTLSAKHNGAHRVDLVAGILLKPDDITNLKNGFLMLAFKGNRPRDTKEYEDGVVIPLAEIKSIDGKAVDQFGANFLLGNYWLYEKKDRRKAAEYYANAAAISFKEEIVLVNLGDCYNAIGYYRDSVAMGERAVKAFPENEKLWCNLGTAYLGMKDLDKAKEAFENIFSTAGESESAGIAHANLGYLYYQQELNTKARSHLEKAVEILGKIDGRAEMVKDLRKLLKRYDKI